MTKSKDDNLVVIIRADKPGGKKRQPLRRTLEQAGKKYFSQHNMRTGCFKEVEGYEPIDGKLVKKAGKKDKQD